MLCANENLPRKGQVRTDPTMRWSVIHTHLYSHRTLLCQIPCFTKNRTRYAGSEPVRWSVLGLGMVDARDSNSPRR